MVNKDEDGRIDKGVLFVRIELREGNVNARGERDMTSGSFVRVRSRCVTFENRREG
jgi:hypothetical protein